ncbi:MAG: lactate dehydrogenase, partial [Polyangiaceae bacterium]|nr:lactate dehydrogenase [Polyangiaceae bacterium]
SAFLVIPEVSSERREFIPIGYLSPEFLACNSLRLMPDGTLFHFAVLNSTMHMAWMRAVCGRLENRYRYSVRVVFNNFPWPVLCSGQTAVIESGAMAILSARESHPGSPLADLYDPRTMPADLRRAHGQNDRVIDSAYGFTGPKSDASRVAFLFDLYQTLTDSVGRFIPSPPI